MDADKHHAEPMAIEQGKIPQPAEAAEQMGDEIETDSEELGAQQLETEEILLQAPEPRPEAVQQAHIDDSVT